MPIRVELTLSFIKNATKLPKPQQKKLAQLLEYLRENPFSTKLHSKSLSGRLTGFYSFRITREWRVIFKFNNPESIKVIDVAHRKDIYR